MILSTGLAALSPALAVQAALESRAACTTTAGLKAAKPVDKIKIRLEIYYQHLWMYQRWSTLKFISIFIFSFGYLVKTVKIKDIKRLFHLPNQPQNQFSWSWQYWLLQWLCDKHVDFGTFQIASILISKSNESSKHKTTKSFIFPKMFNRYFMYVLPFDFACKLST